MHAALIGTSDWTLTGIRTAPNGQQCDHCPRTLRNLYDLTNTAKGAELTVGRGCCKRVTGWTLSAAEARRLLVQAEREARALDTWGDTYRTALAVAQFPHDRAQTIAGALVSDMLDRAPQHRVERRAAELPALVDALGYADAPVAELAAAGEAHRRRRLGLPLA